MTRASDITPLFKQAAVGLEFRQGVIVTWDEASGTNSVNVGGTVLTNLPALNIGDFVHLAPDDVVGILKAGQTYMIMGRVILPGAVDPNRATVDFETATAQASNFGVSTTLVAKVSLTLHPPSWCDEAAIMVGQHGVIINSTGTADYAELHPRVNGVQQAGMVGGAGPSGGQGYVSLTTSTVVASPPSSLLVEGLARAQNAAWAVSVNSFTNISVMALYRRIN